MKTDPCLHIFDDERGMNAFLMQRWTEIGLQSIGSRGSFVAALSGGSTPAGFYRQLAAAAGAFPWDRTHIFLVDERFVPPGDLDSNYGMISSLLLSKVGIPAENIHTIRTNAPSPEKAAEEYEMELKRFFGLKGSEMPVFDFIGLGLGEDGHTASLFTGSPEAEMPLPPETRRLAVAVYREGIRHHRISLTLGVINSAKNIVFIVTGRNKSAIVKRVAVERDQGFPASRVEPGRGTLTFVLDSEAASMLDK